MKTLLVAVALAALTLPSAATEYPITESKDPLIANLLDSFARMDETCSSTEQWACDTKKALEDQLYDKGWCYGSGGWHACTEAAIAAEEKPNTETRADGPGVFDITPARETLIAGAGSSEVRARLLFCRPEINVDQTCEVDAGAKAVNVEMPALGLLVGPLVQSILCTNIEEGLLRKRIAFDPGWHVNFIKGSTVIVRCNLAGAP